MPDENLERFVNRTMPPHLTQEVPPEGYPGGQQAWDEARAKEIAKHRAVCETTYAAQIAIGWTAEEIAEGGRVDMHGDGSPLRFVDRLTSGLRRDAKQAVVELHRRSLRLEMISQSKLEAAAYQPNCGSPENVRAIIKMAQAACDHYDVMAKAEEKVEKGRPELTVYQRCRVIGGREFGVGVYRISVSQALELETWLRRMEGDLKNREPSEIGFSVWPPFRLDYMPLESGQVESPPQTAVPLWQSQQHALSQEPHN